MSAKRKQSAVLQLLRGEDLELVARELLSRQSKTALQRRYRYRCADLFSKLERDGASLP